MLARSLCDALGVDYDALPTAEKTRYVRAATAVVRCDERMRADNLALKERAAELGEPILGSTRARAQ